MSEIESEVEKVVEKVETVEAEVVAPKPDEEAEARRMGWLPEDEYKGDKARWRDAKTFLERGKNELPILRERWKKADAEIGELKKTLKDMAEYQSAIDKKAYERALKDLKAQQQAAVLTQDVDAFNRIDEQIDKLADSIPKPPKIDFEEQEKKNLAIIEAKWLDENPWAKDKEMNSFAYAAGLHLRQMGNDKPLDEFLDDVAAEVKRLRPDKFPKPKREESPAVEGGNTMIRGKGKTFADMDSEAKTSCERMAKNACGDDPKKMAQFKADYVKNYFEE